MHTGQHYDEAMSRLFFHGLGIPEPDIYLGVGSLNHGTQTGKIMIEFEKVLLQERLDLVIAVCDVHRLRAGCGQTEVKVYPCGSRLARLDRSMPLFEREQPSKSLDNESNNLQIPFLH